MSGKVLFTSESVTEGHPDKLCDQISDSILDEMLRQDPNSRVACETVAKTGLVLIVGEITTNCFVDIPAVAKETIKRIGYTNSDYGLDYKNCAVLTSIDEQSPDIALGVNCSLESRNKNEADTGAGDQGMMFGFACDETKELMPLPISFAHNITRALAQTRKSGEIDYLRPDGKSQVTVEYTDGVPQRIDTIVVSTQHHPDVSQETIRKDIIEKVIKPVIPKRMLDENTKYFINPTGRFVIGGPQGDAGLTGRKIIVDTYGGYARHGGGAFSGKDPTKVDRSGAYAARHAAKNIVAAGIAKKCEIQIAYAIGVAQPVSIYVNTFGTGEICDEEIAMLVRKTFDLRPRAIIERMNLLRPIYAQVAAYGHFGRPDLDLPWESLDYVEQLKRGL